MNVRSVLVWGAIPVLASMLSVSAEAASPRCSPQRARLIRPSQPASNASRSAPVRKPAGAMTTTDWRRSAGKPL